MSDTLLAAGGGTKPGVHPVDERLPTGKLMTLGFQHVLVMYAGPSRSR